MLGSHLTLPTSDEFLLLEVFHIRSLDVVLQGAFLLVLVANHHSANIKLLFLSTGHFRIHHLFLNQKAAEDIQYDFVPYYASIECVLCCIL